MASASQIRYKLGGEVKTITFQGVSLPLESLKVAIIEAESLGESGMDLVVTDASSDSVFPPGSHVLKNTSVNVKQRAPREHVLHVTSAAIPGLGAGASGGAAFTAPRAPPTSSYGLSLDELDQISAHSSTPSYAVASSGAPAPMLPSSKAAGRFEQMAPLGAPRPVVGGAYAGGGVGGGAVGGGVGDGRPGPNYRCHSCGVAGEHFKWACPGVRAGLGGSAESAMGGGGNSGPLIFPPSLKSEMHRPNTARFDARFGVAVASSAPQQAAPAPAAAVIAAHLACALCSELLREAVLLPCCGRSACDECARRALLRVARCPAPDCAKPLLADNLLPQAALRAAADAVRKSALQSPPTYVANPTPPAYHSAPLQSSAPSSAVPPQAAVVEQSQAPAREPAGLYDDVDIPLTADPAQSLASAPPAAATESHNRPLQGQLAHAHPPAHGFMQGDSARHNAAQDQPPPRGFAQQPHGYAGPPHVFPPQNAPHGYSHPPPHGFAQHHPYSHPHQHFAQPPPGYPGPHGAPPYFHGGPHGGPSHGGPPHHPHVFPPPHEYRGQVPPPMQRAEDRRGMQNFSSKPPCKYGNECRSINNGKCTYFHTEAEIENARRERLEGRGNAVNSRGPQPPRGGGAPDSGARGTDAPRPDGSDRGRGPYGRDERGLDDRDNGRGRRDDDREGRGRSRDRVRDTDRAGADRDRITRDATSVAAQAETTGEPVRRVRSRSRSAPRRDDGSKSSASRSQSPERRTRRRGGRKHREERKVIILPSGGGGGGGAGGGRQRSRSRDRGAGGGGGGGARNVGDRGRWQP